MRDTYLPIGPGETRSRLEVTNHGFREFLDHADAWVDYAAFRRDIAVHVVRLLTHRYALGRSDVAASIDSDQIVVDVGTGQLTHREMDALGYLDFTPLAAIVTPARPPSRPSWPPGSVDPAVHAGVRDTVGMCQPEFLVTAATYARALLDGGPAAPQGNTRRPIVPIALGLHLDRWHRAGPLFACLDDQSWAIGVCCVRAFAFGQLRDSANDRRCGPDSPERTYVDITFGTCEKHRVTLGQMSNVFGRDVYAATAAIASPSVPGEAPISPR